MPGGKAPIRGAVAWMAKLPSSVNAESLDGYRLKNHAELTLAEKTRCSGHIRDWLARYLGASKCTPVPTITQQNEALAAIRNAAQQLLGVVRVVDRPVAVLIAHRAVLQMRLSSATIDPNTLDLINRWLLRKGQGRRNRGYDRSLHALRLLLDRVGPVPLNRDDRRRLRAWLKLLGAIPRQAPPPLRWPHPHLVQLVQALVPIWSKATGRTELSFHRTEKTDASRRERKDLLFFEWLDKLMLSATGDAAAKFGEGAVLDIVRQLRRQKTGTPPKLAH